MVAALLAVVVALIAMIWQARQTHASSSVDNLWRFLDDWDSAPMRNVRAKACESLKAHGEADEIADLLNFFEELGFLVRHGSLDAQTAWAMFSDWALPYWTAAHYYIAADQQKDPTYWEDFQYLDRTLLDIEAGRRHKPVLEVEPTHEDVAMLLDGEISLTTRDDRTLAPAGEAPIPVGRTFSPWGRKRAQSRRDQ